MLSRASHTVQFLIEPLFACIAWAMCISLLAYIYKTNVSVDYGSALMGLYARKGSLTPD